MSAHNVTEGVTLLNTPHKPLTHHTQFVDSLVSKQLLRSLPLYRVLILSDSYRFSLPAFACGAVGQVRYVNAINKPTVRLNSQFSNKTITRYNTDI